MTQKLPSPSVQSFILQNYHFQLYEGLLCKLTIPKCTKFLMQNLPPALERSFITQNLPSLIVRSYNARNLPHQNLRIYNVQMAAVCVTNNHPYRIVGSFLLSE